METILTIHVQSSFGVLSVRTDSLVAILQETFAKTDPVYMAVHVHTTDGHIVFRRREGAVITRDHVQRRVSEMITYRIRDEAHRLARRVRKIKK